MLVDSLSLLVAVAVAVTVTVRAQQEDYQQPITTDESGIFDFNADLYLNYSESLSDVGTAVATW